MSEQGLEEISTSELVGKPFDVEIMEAIERLHGKKTLIIIAHRLTTIRNCEYIYKVENGKVLPCTLDEQ